MCVATRKIITVIQPKSYILNIFKMYLASIILSKVHLSFSLQFLIRRVAWVFPDFQYVWLAEETKKNLPKELDFLKEGEHCERVAKLYSHFKFLKVGRFCSCSAYLSCLSRLFNHFLTTFFKWGGDYRNALRPSVCPSVTFCVHSITYVCIDGLPSNLVQTMTMCMYLRTFRVPIKQLVFPIFPFLTSGSVQF